MAAGLGVGCVAPGGGPAPVIDRSTAAAGVPDEHVVQAGDSLYRIAWRHQLDYKAIARLNGIGAPYTIYPGQKLKLPGGAPLRAGAPVAKPARAASRTETAARGKQTPASRPAQRPSRSAVARVPDMPARPKLPSQTPPAAPAKPTPPAKPAAPAQTARTPPKPARPAAKAPTPAGSGSGRWRWPVNAKPERGFGRGNNGFDYTVPQGRGVGAAAPGVVVYSGPGLGGYKHLVIVEHGGGYLSAYSINAAPEVSEGGAVTAGARLAEMSGANAVARRLHFEIRRNGAPVDPSKVIGR